MQTDHRGREAWYQKLFRIINSGLCFALAYIVFTQLFWMVTALAGKVFKFDSFVYYYGVKFMLNNHYWNRLNIGIIYSIGPAFALLAGLGCLYVFDKVKNYKSMVSPFLLWGFVVGTSMFAAQGVIASLGANQYNSPYYQNLAVVFAWLRFPDVLIYMLNIPFALVLVYFAVNTGKPFLSLSYSYTKVNKLSRRRRFFVETVMVPFVIGALITSVLTFPMNIFVHAVYMIAIAVNLVVAWYALTYIEVLKDQVLKYKTLQTLNPFLFFVLALVIAFVVLTWRGIYLSYN